MEILDPRRVLAVSSADSVHILTRVLKDLTGSIPEQTSTSLAGTTHNLSLNTAYYKATIPIWIDLVASPSEWAASFLSPDAKEVLDVLGGLIIIFALPTMPDSDESTAAKDLIRQVGKVVKDGLGGWSWDGVSLCLGVGEIDDVDVWEDVCAEAGLEFVQVRSGGATDKRNEFGEKTGISRALEALEANDWANATDLGDLESDLDDFEQQFTSSDTLEGEGSDRDFSGLGFDSDFWSDPKDFEGLKAAIWKAGQIDEDEDGDSEKPDGIATTAATIGTNTPRDKDDVASAMAMLAEGKVERGKTGEEEAINDDEVQKIERMMTKLQAVRDTNAGLPEDQRRRAAARAVAEVMKDL
ncbi:hypothetical protein F5Y16DRAFT_391122 [Xylariaceae sp. FL0255]|nr:hypothetical protein F5Y16DRAFT_391122 [Xylariaceae sp. FL0255]